MIITDKRAAQTPEEKLPTPPPRCHKCQNFCTRDTGYSNWTTLDTEAHCLRNVNPYLPVDESYSWNRPDFDSNIPVLTVAEVCLYWAHEPDYERQMRLDVDGEEKIQRWPRLVDLARAYFGSGIRSWDQPEVNPELESEAEKRIKIWTAGLVEIQRYSLTESGVEENPDGSFVRLDDVVKMLNDGELKHVD